MWKFGTAALLTLIVAGCTAPEKVRAPEQVQVPDRVLPEQRQRREQRQKRIAADQERIAEHLQRDLGPVCTSAGLTLGTGAHARCIDSLYRQELERRAANRLLPK